MDAKCEQCVYAHCVYATSGCSQYSLLHPRATNLELVDYNPLAVCTTLVKPAACTVTMVKGTL